MADNKIIEIQRKNTSQQCKNDTLLSAREARPEKNSIFEIPNSEFQFQNWNNIDPQFQIEITLTHNFYFKLEL